MPIDQKTSLAGLLPRCARDAQAAKPPPPTPPAPPWSGTPVRGWDCDAHVRHAHVVLETRLYSLVLLTIPPDAGRNSRWYGFVIVQASETFDSNNRTKADRELSQLTEQLT